MLHQIDFPNVLDMKDRTTIMIFYGSGVNNLYYVVAENSHSVVYFTDYEDTEWPFKENDFEYLKEEFEKTGMNPDKIRWANPLGTIEEIALEATVIEIPKGEVF